MANMQMNKTPMPEQEPQVRNHNFLEVAQGYTAEAGRQRGQAVHPLQEPRLCLRLPRGHSHS